MPEAAPPAPLLYDAGFTSDTCFETSTPLDIPESAACSDEVFPCESSSCGAFALATGNWLSERCGQVLCGGLVAGVRDGCITTLHYAGDFGESECLREQLVGTRWSCGPENGLARVSLQTCGPI
jgi:hypothetical protein